MAQIKDKLEKEASMKEDFENVKSVLSGNKHSFTKLQKKYQRLIASLIRKMIHNEDDVKDLTQETFIKAYNALSTFQFGYAFSAWIYRIASNTCIDFLRKKRFPTVSINQPIAGAEEDMVFEIEDRTYIPDINYMNQERKNLLMKAINSLPENYREIIKLRHEDELDYNEIAVKMNLPLGTVKAHLFRARKILLSELKGQKSAFLEN
ncbi:MAG: sigma-70 family RNA polymerase sigma factor [Bacteroidetes bacterium]|nr:MAG: sigma-70 family RNA polymerase sigma factor [Bacteroidota bacterium]